MLAHVQLFGNDLVAGTLFSQYGRYDALLSWRQRVDLHGVRIGLPSTHQRVQHVTKRGAVEPDLARMNLFYRAQYDFGRLLFMHDPARPLHYRALMRYLANRFEEIAAEIRDGLHVPAVTALNEIVRQVLPPDDSSLQWSPPGGGFTDDPAKTLDELYKRLVEWFVVGVEQVSRSDEEIDKAFK